MSRPTFYYDVRVTRTRKFGGHVVASYQCRFIASDRDELRVVVEQSLGATPNDNLRDDELSWTVLSVTQREPEPVVLPFEFTGQDDVA